MGTYYRSGKTIFHVQVLHNLILLLHSKFRSAVLDVLDTVWFYKAGVYLTLMHVPVACSWSLAEAARVSEATAGAESLMDGVQGGHGFQLLLATSQTSDPAAPDSYPRVYAPPFLLLVFAVFHCHSIWRAETGRGWKGQRNSGGIRRADLRA